MINYAFFKKNGSSQQNLIKQHEFSIFAAVFSISF